MRMMRLNSYGFVTDGWLAFVESFKMGYTLDIINKFIAGRQEK